MSRIAGIELADNWRVDFALTRIYGIGWSLSKKILSDLKIDPKKRISDLSAEEISSLTSAIDKYSTEGELARTVKTNISRLQAIGSYRGLRHTRNLPVRGQRTRTNARTKRGKRKTVGAFKKEILTKQAQTKEEETKK